MQLMLSEGSTTLGDKNEHTLHRFSIPSGDKLVVHSGGISDQNGDSPNGLELQVHNISLDKIEYKISDTTQKWSPAKKVTSGNIEVEVKINNESGTTKDVTGFFNSEIK